MDRQETKLRQQLEGSGVSVTRQGDNLILNMPGDVTFEVNQSDIKPQFYDVLNSVVLVLKEFQKTSIHVVGYTDSTGTFEYNIKLSEKRAESSFRKSGLNPLQHISGPKVFILHGCSPRAGDCRTRLLAITLRKAGHSTEGLS
jgi:flagellar motor protein MotB